MPGQIKPSRLAPSFIIASIAGGISLCVLKRKKLLIFSFAACFIVTALPGAVVSKPIPKKIIFLPEFNLAISRASNPERTILIFAPAAFSFSSDEDDPGT